MKVNDLILKTKPLFVMFLFLALATSFCYANEFKQSLLYIDHAEPSKFNQLLNDEEKMITDLAWKPVKLHKRIINTYEETNDKVSQKLLGKEFPGKLSLDLKSRPKLMMSFEFN